MTKEKEAVEKRATTERIRAKIRTKQQELQNNQQQQQTLISDLHTKVAKVDSEIEGLEESKGILENQRQAVQKAIEEENAQKKLVKPRKLARRKKLVNKLLHLLKQLKRPQHHTIQTSVDLLNQQLDQNFWFWRALY